MGIRVNKVGCYHRSCVLRELISINLFCFIGTWQTVVSSDLIVFQSGKLLIVFQSGKLLIVFQSGKLVTKMFQRLHDYMVDPELLVCVLIDEVWYRFSLHVVMYCNIRYECQLGLSFVCCLFSFPIMWAEYQVQFI